MGVADAIPLQRWIRIFEVDVNEDTGITGCTQVALQRCPEMDEPLGAAWDTHPDLSSFHAEVFHFAVHFRQKTFGKYPSPGFPDSDGSWRRSSLLLEVHEPRVQEPASCRTQGAVRPSLDEASQRRQQSACGSPIADCDKFAYMLWARASRTSCRHCAEAHSTQWSRERILSGTICVT